MKFILTSLIFLASLTASPVFPGEIIIWHDADGNAHTAGSVDEIPEMFRPAPNAGAPVGVLTALTPAQVQAALAEGKALEARPDDYKAGLGLYRRYSYTLDDKEGEAYLFVGTKYGLIKAHAALRAEKKAEVSKAYIAKALSLDRLYIAFYARGFSPALLLLRQDGTVIKGEDGFGDMDPGLGSSRMTKSFPYEALDFTKPVEVEVYNLDGNSIVFELEWPQ